MAAPSSPEEFLDLVRKSGVVDDKRLDAYLQKTRASGPLPNDLGKFAGILVRDGILTHFQAEQFLQGKWRRFTIGKYKVLERLGSGGMGSVYLCEHKFMRRRVAVKVLPAAKADDPAALERFYREARAVAALDHPNIVRAYDIDQDEKLHFLVMEYVDGTSLQEIIKKHGQMDVTRAAHYLSQAAVGLQHAHQTAGLVHRDIKPGNVLVDRNGVVKILDMGLARFFHDEEDILTKKYDENVLGTADYLAPEQALDSHSVDIRADIYSLGATCYFVLTGCTPFTEGTVAQKLIWHQTRQPKPIRQIRPEVPEGLTAIVEKMMAKNPADRYQSPSDVTAALAPWTQTSIPPPPEKEMPRLSPAAMGGDSTISQVTMTPTPAPAPAARPAPAPARPAAVAPTPMPQPPAVPSRPSGISRPAAPPAGPSRPSVGVSQPAVAQANITTPAPANTPKPAPAPVRPVPARTDNGKPAAAPIAPAPLAPAPQAMAKIEEAPNWGAIAPSNDAASSRRKQSATSPIPPKLGETWQKLRKSPYFWIGIAGIAGVAFLLFVIVLAIMLWPSKRPISSNQTEREPTTLIVSQAGKEGSYKTFRDALKAARPGDKIVIEDEKIEETLLLEESGSNRLSKDLRIESGLDGNKKVIWSCPERPKDERFVSLANAEGVRIKGFVFDGKNRVPDAVRLAGHCPGLTLEDIEIVNFTRGGILVANCAGKSDSRVTVSHVRISGPDKERAVFLSARATMISNQWVTFSNCRFEGNFKVTAVLIEGPMVDVEFKNNRIWNAENAFYYKPGGKPHSLIQLSLDSNTLVNIRQRVVYFEDVLNLGAKNKIVLKNNLFSQGGALVQVDRYQVKGGAKPGGIVAKWIWTNEGNPLAGAPVGKRYFRTAFTPNKKIVRAVLELGIDDEAIVWINGKEVLKQSIGHVQTHDVTSHLNPGKNVIAIMGENKSGPAGLIAQLTYTPEGSGPVKLGTDEKWKSNVAEVPNWISPDFDDKPWQPAKVLVDAYASSPFSGHTWDSAAIEQATADYKDQFDIGKNFRDGSVRDGNIVINASQVNFPPLPTDSAKDDFLLYAANSPLSQLTEKPGAGPQK
jgi:serine/threonine protein kinase